MSQPARSRLAFAAVALTVSGIMAVIVAGFGAYATYQAESFGDRRLDRPTPGECAAARAILPGLAARQAELAASAGTPGLRLGLKAFAWRSAGPRAGRGADWRACRGLGRFVRRVGLAQMNSRAQSPMLYISRLAVAGDRRHATAWVALCPLTTDHASDAPPYRIWLAQLVGDPGTGAYQVTGLAPASLAEETPSARECPACSTAARPSIDLRSWPPSD